MSSWTCQNVPLIQVWLFSQIVSLSRRQSGKVIFLMNTKTKTRRICDLADAFNERIKKASGLNFRDQVLLVAGFLAGFLGLQTTFVYVMWGFILLTMAKFVLLSLSDAKPAVPELEQPVPPHQHIEGEFDVFAEEPEPEAPSPGPAPTP